MAAAKRLPRCVHTREPKGRICQHRRNHPSHRRSNRTSRAFQGQLLQATHSLRAAPTPLTTSAAAPRGPSLWSARPGAARPGSPGRSARSSAATERTRVGAGLGARAGRGGGGDGPSLPFSSPPRVRPWRGAPSGPAASARPPACGKQGESNPQHPAQGGGCVGENQQVRTDAESLNEAQSDPKIETT